MSTDVTALSVTHWLIIRYRSRSVRGGTGAAAEAPYGYAAAAGAPYCAAAPHCPFAAGAEVAAA